MASNALQPMGHTALSRSPEPASEAAIPELVAQVYESAPTDDLMALVHHAQQVSVETVDSLAQLLGSSGALAGSAAAALLIGLLVQRARARHAAQQAQPVDDASLDPL